jgi:hypothetical protein
MRRAYPDITCDRARYVAAGLLVGDTDTMEASARLMKREARDCTVRALAVWADVPYIEAHVLMAEHARRPMRRGCWPNTVADMLGARVEINRDRAACSGADWYKLPRMTVGRFARENPRGRFYVVVAGHALAIIDGIIHDWYARPTRAILAAWKF